MNENNLMKLSQSFIYSTLAILLVSLGSSQAAQVQVEEAHVYGLWANRVEPEKVAVMNVPYFICVASQQEKKITVVNNRLEVNTDASRSNLFMVQRDFNSTAVRPLYRLFSAALNRVVPANDSLPGAIAFSIHDADQEKHKLQIVLTRPNETKGKLYLQSKKTDDLLIYVVELDTKLNSSWVLRPAYDVTAQLMKQIDPSYQLYEMKKKDERMERSLTADQLKALSQLYAKKELTIVEEAEDAFLVATADSCYLTGLIVTTANGIRLRLNNIANYQVGIGDSIHDAKRNMVLEDRSQLDLEREKTLFIKPRPDVGCAQKFGMIEIVPSVVGLLRGTTRLSARTLCEILSHKDSIVDTDCSIEIKRGMPHTRLTFKNTQGDAITYPSIVAYNTNLIAQNTIKVAGDEALRSADRLAKAAEKVGNNIEESSRLASVALKESAHELSQALIASIDTIDHSLTYAAKIFETSIRFLTEAARECSQDVVCTTKLMKDTVEGASKNLQVALSDVSENVKDVSNDAKLSIERASQAFENSFSVLSGALEFVGRDHKSSLETASANFVKGMEHVSIAADALKKMKIRTNGCTIQ